MTIDNYAKALLAIVIWREARGDGHDAMRAVGHVIANRVKAQWGDWVGVITKPNQFSSMTVLGDSQTVLFPNTIQDWTDPLSIAESIYNFTDPDNTKGALYYANEAEVTSDWYRKAIIESGTHPVLAVIGKQTFRY